MEKTKTVLVIGGGVAGAAAADRLNCAGISVHLIEREAAIGGHAAEMGCKAAEKCLRCNVCVADELLRAVAASNQISIHTRTHLAQLQPGRNGSRYTAVLEHKPTFIDRSKCIGCQACVNACPAKCVTKPNLALSPGVPVIDFSSCVRASDKKCSKCAKSCPSGAINMKQKQYRSTHDVDNVVLATGFEPFDPVVDAAFGYGSAANIITGIEAERQLAENSSIVRPSDRVEPKRIAFIQCVGSRSELAHRRPEDTDYCSAVCCAYALRMAKLIKHKQPDAEITVFYMDIQNFGKGFDEFYEECRDRVTFIRSRPYEVKPAADGVVVKYTAPTVPANADSQLCQAEFDLVILSIGIRPRVDTIELAEKLKIATDEYGFVGLKTAAAPELQRDGIFVAGASESPKDIAGSIAQARAVAARVLKEFA